MKPLLALVLFALISTASRGNQATEPLESEVAATVNGVPILESELARVLEMTEFILGAAEFQKAREKLEKSNFEDEIDRRLLRREFKRRGGQIKSVYIDEMVKRFVTDRFKGNKDAFESELSNFSFTEEELKTRLVDDLLPHVFSSQVPDGGDVEQWLESLRHESEIEMAE